MLRVNCKKETERNDGNKAEKPRPDWYRKQEYSAFLLKWKAVLTWWHFPLTFITVRENTMRPPSESLGLQIRSSLPLLYNVNPISPWKLELITQTSIVILSLPVGSAGRAQNDQGSVIICFNVMEQWLSSLVKLLLLWRLSTPNPLNIRIHKWVITCKSNKNHSYLSVLESCILTVEETVHILVVDMRHIPQTCKTASQLIMCCLSAPTIKSARACYTFLFF